MQDRKIPFDTIYEQLKDSLLSYSKRLRLSALKILCSQLDGVDESTCEVLRRCLLGEQSSIDVQGVRERVLHIVRINQILRNDDEIGSDVAARWLIGTCFSMNFYRTIFGLTHRGFQPSLKSIYDPSGNPPVKL